jgi:uncharacterized protein YcfJ
MNRRSPLALVLALAATGAASAQSWGGGYDRYADSGPRWDTARVVNVDPILAPAQPTYRQECWQEPVRYVTSEPAYGYGRGYRGERRGGVGPATGQVLGGIVGAAIGNQIGDGDGRRAATVAGALLGGAIARDSYRNRGHEDRYGYGGYDDRRYEVQREQVRYEQRCRSVEDYRQDDRVVGYRVTYDYNGIVGTTQTSYHPGNTLRVRVDITPEG